MPTTAAPRNFGKQLFLLVAFLVASFALKSELQYLHLRASAFISSAQKGHFFSSDIENLSKFGRVSSFGPY
jgi:hypothetical protein